VAVDERRIDSHDVAYLNRGVYEKSGEFGESPTGITPSQAVQGLGCTEGVETTGVSPNNNPPHEHPTRKGRYSPSLVVIQGSRDKEPCDNKTEPMKTSM